MVDLQTVCCMCGDVGFPHKLFRCNKCRNRFQHSYRSNPTPSKPIPVTPTPTHTTHGSTHHLHDHDQVHIFDDATYLLYCSNFYSEFSGPIEVCDWCQSEGRSSSRGGSSKKSSTGNETGSTNRSEYCGDKIKQHDHHHHQLEEISSEKGKSPTAGTPSPRPSTRRYKLLKDVMC